MYFPLTFIFSLFEILQTLYFAIYGLVDIKHFELKEDHEFTQFVGKTMFGTYSCIMIVVLLNMLIAMLSNSYQNIWVSHGTLAIQQKLLAKARGAQYHDAQFGRHATTGCKMYACLAARDG